MGEAKHTSTPWEFGWGEGVTGPRAAPSAYFDETSGVQEIPIRRGKHPVCWLLSSQRDEDLRPDGEFIVRAVNAHEDLVAAASRLLDVLPRFDYHSPEAVAVDVLRDALKKAEGES